MLCLFAITLSPTGIKFVFWDTTHLCILSVIHSLRSKNGHQANDFPRGLLWPQCPKLWQGGLGSDPFGITFFGPIKSVRRWTLRSTRSIWLWCPQILVLNCGEAKIVARPNSHRTGADNEFELYQYIIAYQIVSHCNISNHFRMIKRRIHENPRHIVWGLRYAAWETRSGAPLVWCFESSPQCPARRHASEFHCWRGPRKWTRKKKPYIIQFFQSQKNDRIHDSLVLIFSVFLMIEFFHHQPTRGWRQVISTSPWCRNCAHALWRWRQALCWVERSIFGWACDHFSKWWSWCE